MIILNEITIQMIETLVPGTPEIYKLYMCRFPVSIKPAKNMPAIQLEKFKEICSQIGYYRISIPKYNKMLGLTNCAMGHLNEHLNRLKRDENGLIPVQTNDPIEDPTLLTIFLGKFIYDPENDIIKHDANGFPITIMGDKFTYAGIKFDTMDEVMDEFRFMNSFSWKLTTIKDSFCVNHTIDQLSDISYNIRFSLNMGGNAVRIYKSIKRDEAIGGGMVEYLNKIYKLIDNISIITTCNGEVIKGYFSIPDSEIFAIIEGKYKFHIENQSDIISEYLSGSDISKSDKVKLVGYTKSAR
jgi:hypothetical protein